MSSSNLGVALYGLARLESAEDGVRIAKRNTNAVQAELNAVESELNTAKFIAKSHVHGLRAALVARKNIEAELVEALKAANANHPLASKEAVEAAVENERVKAILDPEVIKKTYPDGKLPKNAVSGDPLGTYSVNNL